VVSTGDDLDIVLRDPMDEPVFAIDTAGPESGQLAPKGLWFADALVPVAHDVGDEVVEALDRRVPRAA